MSWLSSLAPPAHTPIAVPKLVRKKFSSVRATRLAAIVFADRLL